MTLEDLTRQSGGWESHPDNPVLGRSNSSSSSGGGSKSFRKGDPCPICDQADKRCSLSTQGIYRCWNFRAEGDRSDFAWDFRKLATSKSGGQWGCWKRANRCDRCGTEDSRCWKNTVGMVFCANALVGQHTSAWQFLGQSTGRSGQLWGRWTTSDSPSQRQTTPTTKTALHKQTPPKDERSQSQGEGLSIHQLIWDRAATTLQGRFVDKLASVQINDTAYSRYLTAEAIEAIQEHVLQGLRTGTFTQDQVEASGFFRRNRGFIGSPLQFVLHPGRVIAYFDLSGNFALLRGNAEVPPVVKKRTTKGKIKLQEQKYQQAKGIPSRPYIPQATRTRLEALWHSGTPYHVVITEGEDKAECAAQNFASLGDGIPVITISVPGVWNFNKDGTLHPDICQVLAGDPDSLSHAGTLTLAFDSDVMDKKQVQQAMGKLAEQVMLKLEGKLIPLAANWHKFLREHPELRSSKYGLDDLWGELTDKGKSATLAFDSLLSPASSVMVTRRWQRKGKAWKPEDKAPLLPLAEARSSNRELIRKWFEGGMNTLRQVGDRLVIAGTCGLGKTTAVGEVLAEVMQKWWFAQAEDPDSLQEWLDAAAAITGQTEISGTAVFATWIACSSELIQASRIFPAPGTLSDAAQAVLKLQQQIASAETKKNLYPLKSAQRFAALSEIHKLRAELESLYHQGLGGTRLILFNNKKNLNDFLANNLLPNLDVSSLADIPWFAKRTGREQTEPGIPFRDQVGNGSLSCAHFEAVADVGAHRHSPNAAACQNCFYGQMGRCGFLDSLRAAHVAPLVLATADAVLNASHEIESFSQVVVDEDLSHRLYESIEVGQHINRLLANLQRGHEMGWFTLPPLYESSIIEALIAVFGELAAAYQRYKSATPQEIANLGPRLVDWCDKERLRPLLVQLDGLKPVRWNADKNEVEGATYFPWERFRFKLGESGLPIHKETFGEDQQLAFESIPLRITTEILDELTQAILHKKPSAYLTFERRLVDVDDPADQAKGKESSETGTARRSKKRVQTALYLYRPHEHLIRALRNVRLLNLDATPNEVVLKTFIPDIQIHRIEAELQHTRIIQVLGCAQAKATQAAIKSALPFLAVLQRQGPVLMFTHKNHVRYVDEAASEHGLTGLVPTLDPKGGIHKTGWYNYQDRATDDAGFKKARTLVLVGTHHNNIGDTQRVYWMLSRYRALHKMSPFPEHCEPYRVDSYGPEGYELVSQQSLPVLDQLIEHERTAPLIQVCHRPRAINRTEDTPLDIILLRADPLPEPLNRYVQTVGSIEEIMGVSLAIRNQDNAARQLEATDRHMTCICDYFVETHELPSQREVGRRGKQKFDKAGRRGPDGSISLALSLFSAQLLPSFQNNPYLLQNAESLLMAMREAATEHYQIEEVTPLIPLDDEALELYWLTRYRHSTATGRLMVWMCTRHLSATLQYQLELIEPLQSVLGSMRIEARGP